MDTDSLVAAAREALVREAGTQEAHGHLETVEEIGPDFDLMKVDDVTRWVIAGAIEKAAKRKLADHVICDAQVLADLFPEVDAD